MERKLIENTADKPLQLIEKHFTQLYPGGGKNRMPR